jgi:hypothetical protein
MKNYLLSLFFFSLIVQVGYPQNPRLISKSVRFIYLVSKDRTVNPAYKKAIEMAAVDIQAWYKKQLNGITFKLNSPVVEVAYSDKDASYFYANPNGQDKDTWGFNNTLAECKRLLGTKQGDSEYVWAIYSDGPGNSGRGGGGVCIMPEDDLLGLIGKHPTQPDINRWIAGLGHEIGHAFGLPHPSDTQKDADAIMWRGIYGKYPDKCYLTEADKEKLNQSPFFFDEKGNQVAGIRNLLIKFKYNAGVFSRLKNSKTNEITWLENTQEGTAFQFVEQNATVDFYYLKAENRNINIKIPVKGGQSQLSSDGGKTWRNFQTMTKVKETDSMNFNLPNRNAEENVESIE